MTKHRVGLALFFLLASIPCVHAQDASLNKARNLFASGEYTAALAELERLSPLSQSDKESVAYYTAMCRIRLGSPQAGEDVQDFVEQYPASTRKVEMVTALADELFARGQYDQAASYYQLTDKFAVGKPQRDDYVFRKAYSLYASGDYDSARPLLYSLLDDRKWGEDAAYAFGHICYSQGDMDLALENFLRIQDNPKYADRIPFYLTNIYFSRKEYDRALSEGTALLKEDLSPEQARSIGLIVGRSYFNTGRYREALPYLTRYQPSPATVQDNYQIGFSYYKCGDYAQAIPYLSRLVGEDSPLGQNASYTLGQAYLGVGKKAEALGAFRSASRMDYDPVLQQDAWYNYAVLSYEAGNPYQGVSQVLAEYLERYPESPARQQIFEYLLDSFISAKEYAEAIRTIETMGLDSPRATQALATACFYLAGQKLNEGDYDSALKYYEKASRSATDETLRARADFWLAETCLRLGMDERATEALTDFRINPAAPQTQEYSRLPYQQGFLAEKAGDYATAQMYFTAYQKSPNLSTEERADLRLHLANCLFAQGQYAQAQDLYGKVADAGVPSSDYATYQKALCQGITGDYAAQVATLKALLDTYPQSPWRAPARYQSGMAYQKLNQPERAIEAFLKVESEPAAGELIPEAKSKAALAYYNQGQSDRALALYQEVAEKYPSSSVTPSARRSVRQILVEQGRSDQYVAWSNRISGTPLNEMAVDSLYFETGQKAFSKGDYPAAATAFSQYLEKYPSGLFVPNAAYYLGESALKQADTLAAKSAYARLLAMPDNAFTEGARVKYIDLLRAQDSLEAAVPQLEKLYREGRLAENRRYALVNLLAAYTQAEDWDNTIRYAEAVRAEFPSDGTLYADASCALYTALVESERNEQAAAMTEEVKRIVSGENMAKVLYYQALLLYRQGQYDRSVETISKLAQEYPMYKYIGSRGLLLMAQNFYAQGDPYQGGYILDNVIANTTYPDIREEAQVLKQFMDSQNTASSPQQETPTQENQTNDAI